MDKKQVPDWTPRRMQPGDLYCSPACGGRCTWAAYQKAKKDANALARKLGKGWVPKVWENLGWWYKAQTEDGLMKVHPSTNHGTVCGYTAYFGEGESGGTWASQEKTPEKALEDVLARAEKSARYILQLLKSYRTVTLSKDEIRLKRGTPKKRIR